MLFAVKYVSPVTPVEDLDFRKCWNVVPVVMSSNYKQFSPLKVLADEIAQTL